jgi:biopolymer transport protein ExbD
MTVSTDKKAPFIDMTAMSDVTVLLLTFFMLTSTFLQKEPATVITPASVSEEKVPEQNLVTLLITKDSQIFMSIAGDRDSSYSSEKMREEVLLNVVTEHNKKHPNKKIELTKEDVLTFGNTYMYGLPLSQLADWCKLPAEKRDAMLDPLKNKNAGIPIDMGKDVEDRNEFQQWMLALYNTSNPNLAKAIKSGKGIAIKADATTPYSVVQVVMDNLQTLKMNKFTLMTALKTEED